MDKEEVLRILESIEEKYSNLPEEEREYGSRLSPEKSKSVNYNTYPGTYREIQQSVYRYIAQNPILMNDLDIAIKIARLSPRSFGLLGEDARDNIAVVMEACKSGPIDITKVGNNVLENENYMMMVMQINPDYLLDMNDSIKQNPKFITEYVKVKGFIPKELAEYITEENKKALKKYIEYQIVGMREEEYIGEICEGHNCNFEYSLTELPRHVICCTKGDEKWEISLYCTYGECSSGWTTASWGHMDWEKVEEFGEMTHKPKEPMSFDLEYTDDDGFGCDAFGVAFEGDDPYYPMGGYGVDMEKFIEIQRANQIDARAEFEQALLRGDVVEFFKSKTPEELTSQFGPEVARMVGFEQKNSHHCYDLWEHTLHTVASVPTEGLTDEQITKLKVAAFFHDIGKPEVSTFNQATGQQVFYNHAKHSVGVAKPILEKLGYSPEEIEQLGFFIGHHDDFISYKTNVPPFMRNHVYVRGIDEATIAEKVIENRFDFEAMGYSKDEIRAICYTLAHEQQPTFRSKEGPIDIPVNMDEVRKKMDSGEYDVQYDPTLEDYQLLLQLCRADAMAQSEVAERKLKSGKTVIDGSKREKLENMSHIQGGIEVAYRDAVQKTEYTVARFLQDTNTAGVAAQKEDRLTARLKDGFTLGIDEETGKPGLCMAWPEGSYEETPIEGLEQYSDPEYPLSYTNIPAEELDKAIRLHGGFDKKDVQRIIKEQKEQKFNVFIARTKGGFRRPQLVMSDGTTMSVQASAYHYCQPRRDGLDSYDSYEIGYPSAVLEQLREYAEEPVEVDEDLLRSVFPFVPKDVIIDILEQHGGIDLDASLQPTKRLEGLKQEKSGMESKNLKAQQLISQFMAQLGVSLDDDEPDIK